MNKRLIFGERLRQSEHSVKIRLQPCLVPAMSIWPVAVPSQVPCDVLHNFSCSKLFSAMTKVKVGGSKYSAVCVNAEEGT